MAPAAKQSRNGKIILIFMTRSAPITAEIGSTIPLNCPTKNAFLDYAPYLFKGREMALPSGKF